ncbi:MAG: 4'-phosphopantetheinyl transferase superfamily protein [Gemmatimonadaceae bacterium]|nr:4'-phosphopantetheinyl transferase superfamily protein [Gemmatimonadaceae bacterium]
MTSPAALADDVRRFRRLPVPAPFAEYGAAACVALAEVSAAASGTGEVEMSHAVLAASLDRAVRSRIRSHLAGRHCAGTAIAALTGADAAVTIPIGPLGAPVWPAGLVGSITHGGPLAAAVVAPDSRWRGIGIDCERLLPDAESDDIVGLVFPEAAATRVLSAGVPASRGRLVSVAFSAKESLYKCLAPLAGQFFDFTAARVEEIDFERGTVRLLVTEPVGGPIAPGLLLTARFRVDQDHVYSAVGLPVLDHTPGASAPPG